MDKQDRVIIYQMGKVGSTTLLRSLKHLNLEHPVDQIHVLSERGLNELTQQLHQKNAPLTPKLEKGLEIRKYIDTSNQPKLKVITGVREPISQFISAFFQNLKARHPQFLDETGKANVDEICTHLHDTITQDKKLKRLSSLNWFDKEFKSALGIDIYQSDFDLIQGYGKIKKEEIEVLILRLESSDVWSSVITSFLDLPQPLKLRDKNKSNKKDYAEEYKEVLSKLKFDQSVLKEIYTSKYCQYFYPPEMIEEFIQKWSKDEAVIDEPSVTEESQENEDKQVEIPLKTGESIHITMPQPAAVPSFFAFGMHKSGSVMLMSIIRDICSHLEIPLIEFEKFLYKKGIEREAVSPNLSHAFPKQGYCFSSFRVFPSYLESVDVTGLKKILLIRDPRDMIVSSYFSIKKSHPIAPGDRGEKLDQKRKALLDTEIDDFALTQAKVIHPRMKLFQEKMSTDPNWKLFRYEDIIFNKYQWVKDILAFLEFELEDETIKAIAEKYDIVPGKENESVHIRQVTPGDHKRKLQPETIEKLNQEFDLILKEHRYVE
ncbi:MAG: putative capsular polysaccharide synthesis family protein [Microcoleaceae cyanobacterium]